MATDGRPVFFAAVAESVQAPDFGFVVNRRVDPATVLRVRPPPAAVEVVGFIVRLWERVVEPIVRPIGQNFWKGRSVIGRERLIPGYVAFLERSDLTADAIMDLHEYAMQTAAPKPRHGIVFRLADDGERKFINYRLQEQFGVKAFAAQSAVFCPAAGCWHVIDNEGIAHACIRHSNEQVEAEHGHVPVRSADFVRIPELIQSRNIIDFVMKGDSPRIVYAREFEDSRWVGVEEIGRKRAVFRTLYKQKKEGCGGHPVGK